MIKFSLYVYDANGKKCFQGMPKQWNLLESDRIRQDAEDTHVVIRTGRCNNVFVLDIDDMKFFEEHKDILSQSTYMEKSYSGKRHLYYKYSEKFKSICFGIFDILSDGKQCLLGEPLNDLPIMDIPSDVETLLIEHLSKDTTDLTPLISIMKEDYVKRGIDWKAIGQDILYMGGSLYDWIELSKKDAPGFKKNFDINNINSQISIWNVNFIKPITFDQLLKKQINEMKNANESRMIELEKEIREFAGNMTYVKNGKRFIRSIKDNTQAVREFKCRNIIRLAKKFKDNIVLDWLIENGWLNAVPSYGCKRENKFDLDDPFYWNDFCLLLTLKDKVYYPSEALSIICKNLYRVFAFVEDDYILKKSKEAPFETYNEKSFPDFSILIESPFGNLTSFKSFLKANTWILPSINFKKSIYGFDKRYNHFDAFYCTNHFLAKPLQSKDKINYLLDFIFEIICTSDSNLYDYLMKWFAFMWKFPHLKTGKAVLLYSEEGAGKGTLIDFLCKFVFGIDNTIPNIDYSDLMSNKTSILANKKLVAVNELESARGSKLANQQRLKSFLTEDKIAVNKLYCNLKSIENRMEFIFMTNNELSLRIDNNDRRYVMIAVSNQVKNNIEYFKNLRENIMNEQCSGEFVYHLEKLIDTPNDFLSLPIPMTAYKQEVVTNSNFDSEFYNEFKESLLEGSPLLEPMPIEIKGIYVNAYHRMDLYDTYVDWVKRLYPGVRAHSYPKFKKLAISSGFIEEIRRKAEGRIFLIRN